MISIVDDIGTVVQSMRNGGGYEPYFEDAYENDGAPYYFIGHRREISNRLSDMALRPISKKKRFPLIALNTMSINPTVRGGVWDFNLNIVIGTQVDINLSTEEREAQIFKPILIPIYDAFKNAFGESGLGFMWDSTIDQLAPPHTPMIKYFWGTEDKEGSIKNIFNDPMCAIELVNFKFSKQDLVNV